MQAVPPARHRRRRLAVAAPPHVFTDLPGGVVLYASVSSVGVEGVGPPSAAAAAVVAPSSPEKYFPSWAEVQPTSVLALDYSPGLSSAQNGQNLKAAMQSLAPGEELQVGGGTYTVDSLFDWSVSGTAAHPIRVVAKEGEVPVITRSDASQNTLNVGQSGGAAYLLLRGFEITGGDIALRLYDCSNIWIDQYIRRMIPVPYIVPPLY